MTLTGSDKGPLIQVHVGVSDPLRQTLLAANKPVPPPVEATFLIDTGASMSAVDTSLMLSLQLPQSGFVMIHTPSTQGVSQRFPEYAVMLHMRGASPGSGWQINALPVMGTSAFVAQNIQGLIGRDVLDRGILIYNGPTKHFTLAY